MPRINGEFHPDNVDVRVLKDIVRFGWMSTRQIASRYFLPERPCPARITRLCTHGYLRRVDEYLVKPIYLPTSLGAHCAGVGLKAAPSIDGNDVYHDLTVVDVADYLVNAHPGSRWLTERQVRSIATRRARKRRCPLPGRFPDGMLVLPTGKHIAIEVELSRKTPRRYREILRKYAEQADVERVCWYAPQPSIRRMIEQAIEDCGYTSQEMTVQGLPPGVGQLR